MKKLSVIATLIFVATFNLSAMAEGKIALVSLQRALNEVEEGKRAKASLKADFDSKQQQLEGLKTNLKKMKEDLDKQKMVLSEDALKAKAEEIQTKFMELQQKAAQYENDLKKREADSADKILTSLKGLVADVAKKGGYDMVYENSAEQVLYAPTATDITNELIRSYNAGGGKK